MFETICWHHICYLVKQDWNKRDLKNLCFNLTIIRPLLSALCRSIFVVSDVSIGILQIAPLSFWNWPFGIIVTFLNKILYAIKMRLSLFKFFYFCWGLKDLQLITDCFGWNVGFFKIAMTSVTDISCVFLCNFVNNSC